MTTDEELMIAAGRGSAEAFGELFGRHRDAVWGFFRRRIADRGRAEDLAHDVFVALLNGAARYEPRAPFRAYLFGVAFRLLAAERRRSARLLSPIDDEPSAPALVTRPRDDGFWVRRALARLDQADREILMLREFEQLSYDEIASVLEVPINTVRSRLFRARGALRRLLLPSEGRANGTAGR